MKLPDAWQIKRLEKLVQFSSGGTPSKSKPEFWLGDIPFISAATMHQQEIITSNLNISEEGLRAGSKLAKENDLLLLVRGSMLWKKIPICICKRDVAFNQDVKALSIKGEITPTYLLYWFLAHQRFLLNKVGGTGIGAGKLDFDELKTLDILLPPFPEQKAIADLLSTWDEAIEKTERLIQAKEKRFKWLLRKLISEPRNTQKTTEWKKVKLGEVCKIRTGKLDANAMVKDGQYRFYTCAHSFYRIDQFAFDTEALIISGNGANVGYIHYYKGKFNAYQRTYVLYGFSDSLSIQYLKKCLESSLAKRIHQEKSESNTPYIRLSALSMMDIDLPSIEIQQQIAGTLTASQQEIDLLKQLAEKYKTQKRGLMQNLLTGIWSMVPDTVMRHEL